MTLNFRVKSSYPTFPCAHVNDNRLERDVWLCFSVSHSTSEHVICLELRPPPACAENLFHDLPRRKSSDLGRVHVSCSAASSRCLSEIQEFARHVEFSFHQKHQALLLDLHQRLLAAHHLKLLLPQIPRRILPRRLPRPRHATHFLQSSPSLCEVGSHQRV